jgi:uncharacterized protein with FMN-binding domain
MRRITLAIVTTVAGLVLLFSYRTSTSGPAGPAAAAAPPGIVVPATPAPRGSGPAASGAPGGGATNTGDLTVNGTLEDNGFGPVQVQVKIAGGRIVDVSTLELPGDRHSRQINSFAAPQLRQEVIDAQSAQVDSVSGATATSEAYTRSLQAALDAAHFKAGD